MIINEQKYEAGRERAIKRNARTGNKVRWERGEVCADWQELQDWLFATGEFAERAVAKDPADQEALDTELAAIRARSTDLDYSGYWQDIDCLLEFYDARMVAHPMVAGMFGGDFGKLLLKFRDSLMDWGKLTEKQADVVRKALARQRGWVAKNAERAAERREADLSSEFVGEIKERRIFEITIGKVLSFEGQYGVTYIHLAKDADGNVIIYKGSKRYPEGAAKLKATVKAHETRDGVKQTLIARPVEA